MYGFQIRNRTAVLRSCVFNIFKYLINIYISEEWVRKFMKLIYPYSVSYSMTLTLIRGSIFSDCTMLNEALYVAQAKPPETCTGIVVLLLMNN